MIEPAKHEESASRGFSSVRLFFYGLCMGAADLIPGISGGTIAFLLGFYKSLVGSLQTINGPALKSLFTGKWKDFFDKVAWRFLLPLLSGILFAILSLANVFHFVLAHEVYKIYLYALFFGLIAASFIFCTRQIKAWNFKLVCCLCFGALTSFFLTGTAVPGQVDDPFVPPFFINGWLVFCGAAAICAMLLPGISGSYLLTLLGVYPVVIEAVVNFVNGLGRASFHPQAFAVLFSLGIGIVVGALVFSRALSWMLLRYPDLSIALLSGFMIGVIRAVWPFAMIHSNSEQIIWDAPYFWQAVCFAFFGFVFAFAMEFLAKGKKAFV